MKTRPAHEQVRRLKTENERLRSRLAETEETLRAIQEGDVDAVVINGRRGKKIYSLQDAENLYRRLAETIREPMLALDPEGRIVFFNDRAQKLLGRPAGEIGGHSLVELHPAEDRLGFLKLLRSATRFGRAQGRVRLNNASGASHPVYWRANVLMRDEGKVICLVGTDLSRSEVSRMKVEHLREQREELVAAQAELEASRERFVELFESAPVGYLNVNRNGLVRSLNLTAAKMLGQARAPLLNHTLMNLIAPEDRSRFARHLLAARRSEQPVTDELRFHLASGVAAMMQLTSVRAADPHNGWVTLRVAITDVTQRYRAEEMRARLAAIVDSSNDAIIGKSLDGIITSWNHGAERMLGYPPGAVVGQHITFLVPSDRLAEEENILAKLRRGESTANFDTVRRHKDGSLIPVSLTVSPIKDGSGTTTGASSIMHDITEHKRMEQSLRESEALLSAALRRKDEFLAMLSHELRTPLNPILLLASEAANNRDLPPRVRTDFDFIRKSVELEARLIDDLLDLTRITRGKFTLQKDEIDAQAILRDALANLRADFEQKRILPALDLKAARRRVFGDAVRLRQIFWNVLKNAVKFTPEGGGVSVKTRTTAGKFVVTVADTGIGMSAGELEHIFEAFSQGAHAMEAGASRFGGLGLGLAISRRLVEAHAGGIRAESAGPNRGATFIIELPLATAAGRKAAVPSGGSRRVSRKAAGRIRILLVEDHEPTRTSLTRLLLLRKYRVTPTGSLAEARTWAEKHKFDLLVSDIGLPDGNGYELMAELRERQGLRGIALTGYGTERDVARSREAGFVVHLTKPVPMESLDDALAEIFNKEPATVT